MRKAVQPKIAPPAIAPVNEAYLAGFGERLRSRPLHTRAAYRRDTKVLAALAGERDLAAISTPELRRFLATVHGRGLSGRSLARMLSSWRAFYRDLQDRNPSVKEILGVQPSNSLARSVSATK